MLEEAGRIVAINNESLLVETIQRSTCGSCAAQKGCGQTLLNRMGGKPTYLRVLLAGRASDSYKVNDNVIIGIPDDIVVKGSLFVYLIPLFLMLVFAGIAHTYFLHEAISIAAGVIGFMLGGFLIKKHACSHRDDERYHPVLIDDIRPAELIFEN